MDLITMFNEFLNEHIIIGSIIITLVLVFLYNLYLLPFRLKSIIENQEIIIEILKKNRVESYAYYLKEHEDFIEHLKDNLDKVKG